MYVTQASEEYKQAVVTEYNTMEYCNDMDLRACDNYSYSHECAPSIEMADVGTAGVDLLSDLSLYDSHLDKDTGNIYFTQSTKAGTAILQSYGNLEQCNWRCCLYPVCLKYKYGKR